MTESEAKGFIKGKLDCMKKCDIFNREDNINNDDCDNCKYCYSQGTFWEQKEAFSVAIKALEENQQYRAIGTPEECRAAVEKQKAKKVIDNMPTYDDVWYQCPTCKGDLTNIRGFHCPYCGQKLDWSDEE